MSRPERIGVLDVLRGVAIVGTLGTNIWIFAHTEDVLELFLAPKEWWASAEAFAISATLFFTNGKFLSLLAILFGVGIELQYRAALRRGRLWLKPYAWRTLLLFIEGFLHFLLVFEYDILMGYALAAWVVSFLVTRSRRTLIAAMCVAGALHVLLFGLLAIDAAAALKEAPATAPETPLYLYGSYGEQVANRLDNMLLYRSEALGVLPLNVFLFLLGVLFTRMRVFADLQEGRRLLYLGLFVGVPLNLLFFVPDASLAFLVRYFFAPLMALFYLGLFALLMTRPWFAAPAHGLALIGRTALSCYVLQNILCSILFYGWGFGLMGGVDAAQVILIWLVVCVLLALFASAWLARFERGPLETLWRYLSQLPFQRRGQENVRNRR